MDTSVVQHLSARPTIVAVRTPTRVIPLLPENDRAKSVVRMVLCSKSCIHRQLGGKGDWSSKVTYCRDL